MTSGDSINLLDLLADLQELPAGERLSRLGTLELRPEQRAQVEHWLNLADVAKTFLERPPTAVQQVLGGDVAGSGPLSPAQSDARTASLPEDGEWMPTGPTKIGPYHILGLLGRGGMGEIYKAERRSPFRKIVALKLVKLGFDSREVIARFDSERQALARMDHPNIAKVLDAGLACDGRPYFVMEYVPGVPISNFADNNKLTLRQRLELFMQVCEAIAHAHTKAIIHRDIKASNVLGCLADGKAKVKVIDFGIAKALTGDRLTDRTLHTHSGRPIGTYESMSPEQADGSPDIDTRTDVYSLGVLLYELLTGIQPFHKQVLATSTDEEIRRIIREVAPTRPATLLSTLNSAGNRIAATRGAPLDALTRELRRELEWIPLKAMRKERERRYVSAQQMAEDIDNYLHQRPLIAAPESRTYRVRKYVRRNRAALTAVAAVMLTLVLGIIGTTSGYLGQRRQTILATEYSHEAAQNEQKAVENEQKATLQLAEVLVAQADAFRLAERPDEAKEALLKSRSIFAKLNLPTRRADFGLWKLWADFPTELLRLPGAAGLAVAPDGQTGFAFGPEGLNLWDMRSGIKLQSIGHPFRSEDPSSRLVVAHNGSTAWSLFDGTLTVWDLQRGKVVRPPISNPSWQGCDAVFSHDGRLLLVSRIGALEVWDTATGKRIRRIQHGGNAKGGFVIGLDGRTAIGVTSERALIHWDLNQGTEIQRASLDREAWVQCVCLSPDCHTVATGNLDGVIELWNLYTDSLRPRILATERQRIAAVVFSPDGRKLFAAEADKAREWDIASGQQTNVFPGHGLPITSIQFVNDRMIGLSTRDDETLKMCNGDDQGEVKVIGHVVPRNDDFIGFVHVLPDGCTAFSCDDWYGTWKLWDLPTGQLLACSPKNISVQAIAVSRDGRTMIVRADGATSIYDVASLKLLRTLHSRTSGGEPSEYNGVAISPDGLTALGAGDDDQLTLWKLQTGQALRTFAIRPTAVAFSADGRSAACGDDKGVTLFDLSNGARLWNAASHPCTSIEFIDRNESVVLAGATDSMSAMDASTGKARPEFAHLDGQVLCSPDGATALVLRESKIKLTDMFTQEDLLTLQLNGEGCYAFAPDGSALLTGNDDGALRLYDFTWPRKCLQFDQSLARARATLQQDPDDANSIAVLGEWYAFRGIDDWAIDLLERARAAGARVPHLTLARCYWKQNRLGEALEQFQASQRSGEAPQNYLELCIAAVQRARQAK
jgi:serine/threonine protein kinase/WD40 repeat protein